MSLFPRRSIIQTTFLVVVSTLALICIPGTAAFAQRGGRHVSGGYFGGPPFGGPGHIGAPHGFISPGSYKVISRPRFSGVPPLAGFGTRTFFPRRPIRPLPPIFPILRRLIFFGSPFFSFGVGLGLNSFWWPNCGPFWGGGFGCNGLPFYEYDFGNYGPPYIPSLQQTYEYPPAVYPNYFYGGGTRQLAQLYLNDGTVYNVTDYWLANDQLHFRTVEDGGAKLVEHVTDFDQLDLQKTIDVNTERGFHFVLRNEPLEEYLRDHPDTGPAGGGPPQTGPAGPLPPPQ